MQKAHILNEKEVTRLLKYVARIEAMLAPLANGSKAPSVAPVKRRKRRPGPPPPEAA